MLRILKIAFIAFFSFLALVLIISLFLPSDFKVERSIVINAPVESIEPYFLDLTKWPIWSVWNKQSDSTLKFKYFGSSYAAGSIVTWDGEIMGRGLIEITSSIPEKSMTYKMAMEDNRFENFGTITFTPDGYKTIVAWTAKGNVGMNPVARYFVLFMDKFMGPDFEKGLAKLKRIIESSFVRETNHARYRVIEG